MAVDYEPPDFYLFVEVEEGYYDTKVKKMALFKTRERAREVLLYHYNEWKNRLPPVKDVSIVPNEKHPALYIVDQGMVKSMYGLPRIRGTFMAVWLHE